MNAKHLTKNAISHKLVFLAVAIAIALIAAFSICATTQANAQDVETTSVSNEASFLISINPQLPKIAKVKFGQAKLDTSFHPEKVSPDTRFLKWKDNYNLISKEIVDNVPLSDLNLSLWQEQKQGKTETIDNAVYTAILHVTFTDSRNGYIRNVEFPLLMSVSEEVDFKWAFQGKLISEDSSNPTVIKDLDKEQGLSFTDEYTEGDLNVSGVVTEAGDWTSTVPFAFVQYCRLTPWGPIPVPEMSTFTDFFGRYTIEGIDTEEMLPGVIRVYKWGYEVGESLPIYYAPEGMDTIYRTVLMTPEQPVPPVPPTPPEPPTPPVPPQPVPPEPVPPVPTPTPTPVDPGTNIPQTGDTAGIALAITAMIVLCGAYGASASAKRRKFDK